MQSLKTDWRLSVGIVGLACLLAYASSVKLLYACLFTLSLTGVCFPLFERYALARPNARSSHRVPVPQGGGAAIILAVLLVGGLHHSSGPEHLFMIAILVATVVVAMLGAWDDIKPLPAALRLGVQAATAIMLCVLMPSSWRALPLLPEVLERGLLALGLVWFVNLTNFMDGIDGITVVGFVPLAFFVSYLLPGTFGTVALALAGALLGFMIFNWHPAKLFMGDVGSLPIGLLGGFFLIAVAAQVSLVAAVILPLYHVTDATWTLLVRLWRREKVWEAHRQHAYQNAVDSGLTHTQVSGIILALNMILCGLATIAVYRASWVHPVLLLVVAFALTVAVIVWFRTRVA
jgi:UDP-N-acetylmuramyl pentapeptide phosphotransferase/UDP-N-acetylglucosamine-1-phosphate transferase